MDTIWRGACLALLMLATVAWNPASRAQEAAYEECYCRLGCVPGEPAAAPGGHRALRFPDCLLRMSGLTFVGPSIPTFVMRVRNPSLSATILRYFDDMLSIEFALTISKSDARAQ